MDKWVEIPGMELYETRARIPHTPPTYIKLTFDRRRSSTAVRNMLVSRYNIVTADVFYSMFKLSLKSILWPKSHLLYGEDTAAIRPLN